MRKNIKRLGILGGMGPEATADLFIKIVKLTPAENDQEHIPIVIDNYPQIEDRTNYIINGKHNPLPKLLESAERLEKAGVDAILMSCNTAHYFADDIKSVIKVPLIHIAEVTAKEIVSNYPNTKNIGLIATKGTKKARIYENILSIYNLNILKLPDDIDDKIMKCIYDGVKSGKINEYIPLFQDIVGKIEQLGVDILIAGCTEIPILLPYVSSSIIFIDPTLELAKAAIKFAKS